MVICTPINKEFYKTYLNKGIRKWITFAYTTSHPTDHKIASDFPKSKSKETLFTEPTFSCLLTCQMSYIMNLKIRKENQTGKD